MTVASSLNQSTARPILNTSAINGRPAVAFTGISNLQNNIVYNYPNTIFILAHYTASSPVGRILSGTNNNWLMGWYAGNKNAYYVAEGWVSSPGGPAAFDWDVYTGEQTAGTQRLFQNSQLVASTSLGGTSGPDGLSLGGWSFCCTEYSAAEIAEVIVYDRVLTDAERQSVLFYLNQRYALGI